MRRSVGESLTEAKSGEEVSGALALHALWERRREKHGQHDVFQRRKGGQQVKSLEDIADLHGAETVPLQLRQAGDVRAIDLDVP